MPHRQQLTTQERSMAIGWLDHWLDEGLSMPEIFDLFYMESSIFIFLVDLAIPT